MLLDREDPEFREFAELFDICLEDAYGYAGPMAQAQSEGQAGDVYSEAWMSMEKCASARIAARFPKPAPDVVPTTQPTEERS